MISLRNILKINAISSGATGLGLVAFSGFFASLFEVDQSTPFMAVGIFLLVFAGFVMLTALQKTVNPPWVKIIIWLDTSWVMGSIIAVLWLMDTISLMGSLLMIGVAIWVAAMALLQNKGLHAGSRLTGALLIAFLSLSMDTIDVHTVENGKITEAVVFSADPIQESAFWSASQLSQ